MSNFQVFIPNFPPPPLLPQFANNLSKTTPAIPSVSSHTNSTLYKDRLNSYLEGRKHRSTEKKSTFQPQNALKLSEVSLEMSQCDHLIQVLKENIKTLSKAAPEMDTAQWNDHLSKLNSKVGDLSAICFRYDDTDVRTQVKILIDKRQEKRNRIRKRKMETKVLKKYEASKRERKHQKIDEWVEKNAAEILKNRQQIETKQRAEQMFIDVKSRQNEADKYIQLMESLKELNRIRNRDKYIGSGQNNAELNRELDDMKQMWLDVAKTYEVEEKRLRKFINYTDDWEEWRNILFGEPTKEDRFVSLHKKNDSISQLIAIRSLWDQFIVSPDNPFGSSVPLCWALPNANPSEKWKVCLENPDNL
ncbi:uncharacterized protein LOC129570469 [Sitodiplosis mosellana]|uniref:uncharacterized protein LOC129570469 n=1 Tax=Sitodiplosis mosellana TaxID=263140 RepID=UPI002443AF09|nr:uncharacterized protein LOC129570469 [Sitodiplosis mosellana]